MIKNGCKIFHFAWLIFSIFIGLFVISQISSQTIDLPSKEISLNKKIEENKKCEDIQCSISSPSEDINISNLSPQLEGFNNFFPLSAISKLNLIVTNSLEGNVFLEVTNPQYSERVQYIKVYCIGETIARFDTEKPRQEFTDIRPYLVNNEVSKYFQCEKPNFSFIYKPDKKIKVGPNEYIKFTTQGTEAIVTLKSSILFEPNFLTKTVIFLIAFFLTLAAGNILYFFLRRIFLFRD